jgi:hypothetical protein
MCFGVLARRTGVSPETNGAECLAGDKAERSNRSIMKHLKIAAVLLSVLGPLCVECTAQPQKVFQWQPANDESVRLDPAYYHAGRTYHRGPNGGNIHVDIKAQKPVTVFLADAEAWIQVQQRPETLANLPQICTQEHVVETTYVCDLPPAAMTLVIRDERNNPDAAVFAGLGAVLDRHDQSERAIETGLAAVLTGTGAPTHKFFAPNDVHIQYYRWDCVENCIQPEYQWIRQIKEKYELTSFVKVYGGFVPDHDKTQMSIKINSPTPMIVAVLPSQVADQLHSRPDSLETALEKNACQQRGVQKLEFQCTFNLADGPQSLVVVPEPGSSVPHKKAEVEMTAVRCVANCQLIEETKKPSPMAGLPKSD